MNNKNMQNNPKTTRKHKVLYSVIIICTVILSVQYITGYKNNTDERDAATPVSFSEKLSYANSPLEVSYLIRERVSSSSEALTAIEKKLVADLLLGDKIQQYNFSAQEKLDIVKALNK